MTSLDPFTQTILEEDELFYRTFPDARPDNHLHRTIDVQFYPLTHTADSSLFPALALYQQHAAHLPSPPPPYSDIATAQRHLLTHQQHPQPQQQPQHPQPTSTPIPQRKQRPPARPLRNPRSPSAEQQDSPPWSIPGEGSPPPSMRLDPAPTKRPLAKKPPLACLFCRGRKIACGPPLPGSDDKTCNQCQRRALLCQYPSESRRGMRKKKVPESDPTTPQEHASTTPVSP